MRPTGAPKQNAPPDSSYRGRDYCNLGQPIKTLSENRVYTLDVDQSDGNAYLASFEYDALISYDSRGSTRRWSVTVNRPRGVVASNGYVYVNALKEHKLKVYNSDGGYLNEFYYGSHSRESPCHDIDGVVTGSDTITLYCINRDDHIYQFYATGSSISFGTKWGGSTMLGYRHGGITAIQDPFFQRLLVSRADYYEIIKLHAHDHSVMSRFGHNNLPSSPEGLCVDEFGYVLVSGAKDIRVFGPGDDYRCKFPKNGDLPDWSYDVAIAPDGAIWVSSWRGNQIWIF